MIAVWTIEHTLSVAAGALSSLAVGIPSVIYGYFRLRASIGKAIADAKAEAAAGHADNKTDIRANTVAIIDLAKAMPPVPPAPTPEKIIQAIEAEGTKS